MTSTSIPSRELDTYLRVILSAVAINTRLVVWSVFALGFALYLVLNVGLVLLPMQARSAPTEVDDTYAYILKAVQMVTCFRQDCPALVDLRSQLNLPSTDLEMAWVRYREYGRAFCVYHPLHSVLVAVVHTMGLSWERAYDGICLAGSVFICTVIAYWLVTLWGPGPAGVTLILLALMVFPDQTLRLVVPSDLAIGIAMLIWARISARDGAAVWSLALGTLAMVAMHPIGRLFAIASVFLFLLFATGRPWTKGRLAGVLFSSSIVALSFLLPVAVHRPELTFRPDPPLAGWPESWYGIVGYGLVSNLRAIDKIVKGWTAPYGTLAQAVIITAFGFLSLPRVQRSTVVKNGLVLVGLLIMSAIYVLPRYPADVFRRVWVPMAILLTGATGQVAWIFFVRVYSYFANKQRNISLPLGGLGSGPSALLATPNWIWTLIIAIGIFVAVRMEAGIFQGPSDVKAEFMTIRNGLLWALDPAQPQLMLAQVRPSDVVLYIDEVPMHFYFTHGALNTRVIYYPAIVNPSHAVVLDPTRGDGPHIYLPVTADTLTGMRWLDFENLRYLVTWSPIQQHPESREAMIPMSAFTSIEYSSPAQVALSNLRVYLINSGREAALQVVYPSQNTTKTVRATVPGDWSGWLSLPGQVASDATRMFSFKIEGAGDEIYMKGIRFGDTNLNWPWEQRATLVFQTGNSEGRAIRFDPDELLPISGLPVSVKILHDNGSTVLSELVRSDS